MGQRFARPASKRTGVNDQCAVGIGDIPRSSFAIPGREQFGKRVTFRDPSIFIEPAGWTPAATFRIGIERGVERAAINAGLAAGNNLEFLDFSDGRY